MITVWNKNNHGINVELAFSTTLPRQDAEIRVVAKDYYNLFVNGKFVSYGPARTASGYARVDKIELGDFLTEQVNEIVVFVVAVNAPTLSVSEDEPYFGAEIVSDGKVVATTRDFVCRKMNDRVSVTDRAASQRGFTEVYRFARRYLSFNANDCPIIDVEETNSPVLLSRNVSFSKNEVATADRIKDGFVFYDQKAEWNGGITIALDEGRIPKSPVRDECEVVLSRELPKFNFGVPCEKSDYKYEIFALQTVECGKFRFSVNATADSDIWLIYDDCLTDGYVSFRRENITHGMKWSLLSGEHVCYSSEVYSAKYVAFVICGDAEITDFSIIRIENPDASEFSFTCEDKQLEDLVEASKRSLKHNAYDILTDCPSRERAGWLCDSYFSAIAERFFTGKNVVEGNFLENYDLFKNEKYVHDGVLPECYPSFVQSEDNYIPNWILWFVIETLDECKRGGKPATEYRKNKIRSIVDFFSRYENEYGLLENLDGWVFVEWSKADDFVSGVNFPSNALYVGALKAASEILGDNSLSIKADEIKKSIMRLSYNGKYFRDHAIRVDGKLEVQEDASETCQYYAAFFEVIGCESTDFYASLYNRFSGYGLYESNIFIGYVLRLLILARDDCAEELLAECKDKFYPMAKSTGTIWELFSGPSSKDHGFGSILGKLVVYAVFGIKDIDYAQKRILMKSRGLNVSARVKLPTEDGIVEMVSNLGETRAISLGGYEIIYEE